MSRRPKDEIDRTVREAAAVLELEHLLDRKPAALSGGQRQRVAMGRAIVRQPDVFLFDEPLSNLDAQLRTQMRLELKKMHRRLSTTTVYVTHDQIEAMTLADRIVILQGGRIQQVGTPAEVYDNPANVFVARFIGNPPMNIFAGAILVQDGQRVLQAGALTLPVPEHIVPSAENGRPVLAGLRPDAIKAGDSLQRLPDDWIRPADIGLAEVIGSQTLLELSTGGQTFLAEVKSRLQLQAGQTADIGFDMNRLVLFDPQTTLAMS